jgi:uncharacterized membrane protein YeaQ/YmgE (transglycosylase-associated protein family)
MTILGFVLFVCLAGGCAWLAEQLVPNAVPGGLPVTAVVGIMGAWLGTTLFGQFGPQVAGIALVPAIFGAILFVFAVTLGARAKRVTL